MVRFVDSGDESDVENGDGLAPVTSLFGDRDARTYAKTADDVRQELERRIPAGRSSSDSRQASDNVPSSAAEPADRAAAAEWTTEWDAVPRSNEAPAPDVRPIDLDAERAGRTRSGGAGGSDDRGSRRRGGRASAQANPGDAGSVDAAELGLLKKLRARQLSVSEAKTYLGQHDLDGEAVATILDAFLERGYLDDARLAEQVVHAGVDRKGQGRQAISQSLAKRGVPRDIADAALAELPDDDAERALEFARTKAGSMRGLERDVALRRLAGQLARRGYGGSSALNAARQALDEATRPSGRVRFD